MQINPDEDSLQRLKALRGEAGQPPAQVHLDGAAAERAPGGEEPAEDEAAARSRPAGTSAAAQEPEPDMEPGAPPDSRP